MVKKKFFYSHSLSIVLLFLVFFCLIGQFFTGWDTENKELAELGQRALSFGEYLHSGHFIQGTFENCESEFLQMMLYVLLTVSLRQKGSSESKSLEGKEEVDREPKVHQKAPWAVKKGGVWLAIYKHSLSIAFAILFLASFLLHFYGSLKDFNTQQILKKEHVIQLRNILWNQDFGLNPFKTGRVNF